LAILAGLGSAGIIKIESSQIAISTLFLSNFLSEGFPWVLVHTWSLAFEEQFYLIFPILFVSFRFTERPQILLAMISVIVLASIGLKVLGLDRMAVYLVNMNFLLSGCATAFYWERLSPIFWFISQELALSRSYNDIICRFST
jgi:peptidoglycan/LPS O-acetylase OafA/YrhL